MKYSRHEPINVKDVTDPETDFKEEVRLSYTAKVMTHHPSVSLSSLALILIFTITITFN